MVVSHAEQSSLFIELTHNFLSVNFKLLHYRKITPGPTDPTTSP
jgi:hypothetical protein